MKILLPVDGTELSLHETRFALRLVQEGLRAEFVLANVQEPATLYERLTARDNAEMLANVAQGAGESMLAPAAQLLEAAGVPYQTTVLSGDAVPAILEVIESHGCDMVVMGSRAMGSWLNAIEGSTASKLTHDSPVPVLVVQPPQLDTVDDEEQDAATEG